MNDDHGSYTQPTRLREESLLTILASNAQVGGGGGGSGVKVMVMV